MVESYEDTDNDQDPDNEQDMEDTEFQMNQIHFTVPWSVLLLLLSFDFQSG